MKQLRLDYEQLGVLCRALGQMYHAGICTGDALSLMAEDEPSAPEKELLQSMSRMADEGTPLSDIFCQAGCFPGYLCHLMAVGEQVGKSEDTLQALADYYDGRARLSRQMKNALVYPSVLLVVLLAVILILLVWVLPVFNDVYGRLGSRLTGFAGGLLALGSLLRRALPLLGALLAAAFCAAAAAVSSRVRDRAVKAWYRSHGHRGIGRKIQTARFTQALAMAMAAGMADREAVELASGLAEGSFQPRCEACLEAMDRGAELQSALRESEMLSSAQCRLLETGIRSGNGAQMMERIAQKALEDSEYEIEALAGRIEPAVVIVMSVLVGGILLCVMLPLMHIMTAIG